MIWFNWNVCFLVFEDNVVEAEFADREDHGVHRVVDRDDDEDDVVLIGELSPERYMQDDVGFRHVMDRQQENRLIIDAEQFWREEVFRLERSLRQAKLQMKRLCEQTAEAAQPRSIESQRVLMEQEIKDLDRRIETSRATYYFSRWKKFHWNALCS